MSRTRALCAILFATLLGLSLLSQGAEVAYAAPGAPPAGHSSAPAAGSQAKANAHDAPAEVKLHDAVVMRIGRGHGSKSAEVRARGASRALEQVFDDGRTDVHVVVQGDTHIVYAGDVPILELYAEDAAAAGDASLQAHSGRASARVRQALAAERTRSDIAETLFWFSVIVTLGLFVLFALRKLGEAEDRVRSFVLEHPERIPAIRLQSFEVIGKGSVRGVLLASLIAGRVVLQVTVIYLWLVFALSRFEATKPLEERLSSFVVDPLLALAERVLLALPLGFLIFLTGALVYVALRFVELFFASVRRGEAVVAGLPHDLVPAVSVLVRVAIVLLALVFGGPLVTGDPESAMSRAGVIVLLALSLAATPLLAAIVIGMVQVFSRRIRVGQELSVRGHRGRVVALGLFDVLLVDASGHEVRVPHLLALVSPMTTESTRPRVRVEIAVDATVPPQKVLSLLQETASRFGHDARAELRDIDRRTALWQAHVRPHDALSESELRIALVEALATAGIALGEGRAPLERLHEGASA